MFGFLGIFGRSRDLRQFDQALRAVDMHPALVPEAVKLAAVRIVRASEGGLEPEDCRSAAELLAYCMTGAQSFAGANGSAGTEAVESRIEAALESGDSTDAQIVLLALHAGVLQPSVIERYQLSAASD